jgi:hypothetical protein
VTQLLAAIVVAGLFVGATLEETANFVILAPDGVSLSATAEEYRAAIAREVLGEELPDGIAQAIIHVEIGPEQSGLFWAIGSSDRRYHKIWVKGPTVEDAARALKHEMAHLVLAAKYDTLPAWLDEGIASQYDDAERVAQRERLLRWCVENGRWPDVARVLGMESIGRYDVEAYAVASSLVAWLRESGKDVFTATPNESEWRAWLRRGR